MVDVLWVGLLHQINCGKKLPSTKGQFTILCASAVFWNCGLLGCHQWTSGFQEWNYFHDDSISSQNKTRGWVWRITVIHGGIGRSRAFVVIATVAVGLGRAPNESKSSGKMHRRRSSSPRVSMSTTATSNVSADVRPCVNESAVDEAQMSSCLCIRIRRVLRITTSRNDDDTREKDGGCRLMIDSLHTKTSSLPAYTENIKPRDGTY